MAAFKEEMLLRSFSGSDIIPIAIINGKTFELGNLQTISISSHRDTTPVRALGLDAPIQYTQGTRTISGSMVFTKVNKARIDDMFNEYSISSLGDVEGVTAPDRLPGFDIHIHKGTEYGDKAIAAEIGTSAVLKDITLMTSGVVISVHDIITEQTYNFVAREFIDFNAKDNREEKLKNTANALYRSLYLRGQ